MSKIKALVISPFLQHYRFGVFSAMDQTEGIEYTFVSDEVGRAGVKPLPIDSVKRHILTEYKECGPFSWQKGLLQILLREQYDVVIFFAEISSITTWLGTALARLRRKPVFFWTTGWHRPEGGAKKVTRNFFYRTSSKLMLYGELGKSIGKMMGFPSERMAVIGNSVEPPIIKELKNEKWTYSKDSDALLIGAVIRLIPVKKLDLIIRAVSLLQHEEPSSDIRILIVGEGPERDYLQNLAAEKNVKLEMPGAFYSASTMEKIYADLDITVVPAAVGLTAIQSMSHGVPVISNDSAYTQMPEWESIKPGITGELFEEDNIESLAGAIKHISDLSEEEKNQMSLNCKQEIQRNWTATAHAKKIEETISEYLAMNSYLDNQD